MMAEYDDWFKAAYGKVNSNIVTFVKKDNLDALIHAMANGGDLNYKDSDGETFLHFSAWNNSLKCMRYLIVHGANVNQKNNCDMTPLFYAAGRGNLDGIKILLENNADHTAKSTDGMTAAEFSILRNHHESSELIKNYVKAKQESAVLGGLAINNDETQGLKF